MNLQTKNNARDALNNLKAEIFSELGYCYNLKTDKIEGFSSKDLLDEQDENIRTCIEANDITF